MLATSEMTRVVDTMVKASNPVPRQEKLMLDEKEKMRALQATLGAIEKQFGKGSVLRLGSKESVQPVAVIPSGSISLDHALGVGGFPRGRIIEVYGPESSGKTTIALQVVAEAQKAGGVAAFVDVEHALDPVYARKLGVDIDNLLVSQPDFAEQALEITNTLIQSGSIDVLVVDSVAALVPKAELDGEMGDSFVGVHARLMSQAMRKLTGIVAKSNTCLIFINQIREKIGVMFGSPETTTGGRALKFYSSVRLDIRRISSLKEGEEVIGNRTKVKVVKTRSPRPSAKPSSTSSTARASPAKVTSSTSLSPTPSSRSPAPGTATKVTASARAATTLASSSRTIRTSSAASTSNSATN